MKIRISCESQILQKTLSWYLKDYISDYDNCDFVISDTMINNCCKPVCLVNFTSQSNIQRPMYRDTLIKDLVAFYESIPTKFKVDSTDNKNNVLNQIEIENIKQSLDYINSNVSNDDSDPLKTEIDNIVRDFADKLYNVIKNNEQIKH